MKATLAVRQSLRPWLDESGSTILLGVSGGADSLALAIATLLEAKNHTIIPVIIDHGLQEGSDLVAESTSEKLSKCGYEVVEIIRVNVRMSDGLEASARRARYEAFEKAIEKHKAQYFFLGHTQDDLAEQVLLGLARGSGTRSLSGMSAENGKFIRPMLEISRSTTLEVCREHLLEPWNDPHNEDQRFTRAKVRHKILPLLERELGPGISEALARTSRILREDADALDEIADDFISAFDSLDAGELATLPKAVRSRVLRKLVHAAGVPAGTLTADHLAPIEALVTAWNGQGPTSLPGGVKVERISGRLSLSQPTTN
jgi:tRNA(Ile)-lysidine synthase